MVGLCVGKALEKMTNWSDENKQLANESSVLDVLKSIQKKNNFNLIYPNYTTFKKDLLLKENQEKNVNPAQSNEGFMSVVRCFEL